MFESITPDTIKENILKKITRLNTQQGGFTDDMVGPTALELFRMYSVLNTIKTKVWPDETSGEYLDLEAKRIGLERKKGRRAAVTLELTGAIGHTVPEGSAFLTEDDLYFDTTKDVTILENSIVLVEARAREIGSSYNVLPNTIICQLTSDSRIEKVTNKENATGGADIESDKGFFERIESVRKRPATSGNKYHYENWALEVNGVGYARCFPLWNGNGTVKILIANEDRNPVDSAILENCYQHIEEMRPIGAKVTVENTKTVLMTILAEVILEKNKDVSEVAKEYTQVLNKSLAEVSLENEKIVYHWVGAVLMGIDGVINYKNLTINGLTEDILLLAEEVPIVGEVVLG